VLSTGAILLALILAVAFTLEFWPREVAYGDDFKLVPVDFHFYDWFDAGAADLNADKYLDIYTSNHDARQNLLLGTGDGQFTDALSLLGFDQDREFPGLEDTNVAAPAERHGFYMYYLNGELVLQSVGGEAGGAAVSGVIKLASPVSIGESEGFQTKVDITQNPGGIESSVLSFASEDEGKLAMTVPFKASPVLVELGEGVSLGDVFIGHQRVNPKEHQFELYLRDRHGIAWSDLNDDGIFDAFVVRGGLNGQIRRFPVDIGNELLLTTENNGFENVAPSLGFAQRGCPGRQVMWVDYDNDGDLDLYLVCGRQTGGFWEYVPAMLLGKSKGAAEPNRLYKRLFNGKFIDVAEKTGLNFSEGGVAAWLDVDSDYDMDLIWSSEQGMTLYRNYQGRFEPEVIQPESTTQVRKLVIGDFDVDGDPDIYAVSAIGGRLLVNNSGKLQSVLPDKLGLPSNTKTASWIDYDNDGLLDLYAWPQGIFRQLQGGQFEKTDILSVRTPWSTLMDARVLWFDYDNDGDRDVLVLQRYFPHVIQEAFPKLLPFSGVLLENMMQSTAHWIEVRLIGDSGNREAIGSRVSVSVADSVQHQWIGQSEGSHYSQGHYRTYFGLGAHAGSVQVDVQWPNGKHKVIQVPVDQLIVIAH